jgi:hypothetical protein
VFSLQRTLLLLEAIILVDFGLQQPSSRRVFGFDGDARLLPGLSLFAL